MATGEQRLQRNQGLIAQGTEQGQGPDLLGMAQELGRQRGQEESGTRTPGTGVGIIDIFTRKKRQQAQTEINTQQALKRAADVFDASGVDANKLTTQELEGLQRLALTDEDAFDRQMDQIEMAQGLNMSPQTKTAWERDVVALNRERLEAEALARQGFDSELTANMANQIRDERRADLGPVVANLQSAQEVAELLLSGNRSGAVAFSTMYRWIKRHDNSVVRA